MHFMLAWSLADQLAPAAMLGKAGGPEVSFKELHSPGPMGGRLWAKHLDVVGDLRVETDLDSDVELP